MKLEKQKEARKLRSEGVSVKTIAKQLGVSPGSVSLWVKDIVLTIDQLEALRQLYGAIKYYAGIEGDFHLNEKCQAQVEKNNTI